MQQMRNIPLDQIIVSPNVRSEADEELRDLMESIDKYDLLQPILVRPRKDGRYELVTGHRRFTAMQMRGEATIPCYIRADLTDGDLTYIKLSENIQRKQLSAAEIVEYIDTLQSEDPRLTDQVIARRLHKSPAWIFYKRRIQRTYQALAQSGTSEEVLKQLTDSELFKLSGIVVDKVKSEAAKKADRKKTGKAPDGMMVVLQNNHFRVYARKTWAGSPGGYTIIMNKPEYSQELIEYLQAYKAKGVPHGMAVVSQHTQQDSARAHKGRGAGADTPDRPCRGPGHAENRRPTMGKKAPGKNTASGERLRGGRRGKGRPL